jgi:hypothetical protein
LSIAADGDVPGSIFSKEGSILCAEYRNHKWYRAEKCL